MLKVIIFTDKALLIRGALKVLKGYFNSTLTGLLPLLTFTRGVVSASCLTSHGIYALPTPFFKHLLIRYSGSAVSPFSLSLPLNLISSFRD